jgi:hypothetical protein
MDVRAQRLGVTNWIDVNYPWLLLPIVFGLIAVAIY